MDWGLMVVLIAAGYGARWAQDELGGKLNWWFLPYRQRCRRISDMPPMRRCKNRAWRIRWSSLAPLSVVCRGCRETDAGRRVEA